MKDFIPIYYQEKSMHKYSGQMELSYKPLLTTAVLLLALKRPISSSFMPITNESPTSWTKTQVQLASGPVTESP